MNGTAAPCVLGDWGSTRLRLRLVAANGCDAEVQGPGLFATDATPADVLAELLAQLDPHGAAQAVYLCGMAGTRGGLAEVPYAPCPADPDIWVRGAKALSLAGRRVTVFPGLVCRDAAGQADVMRGEEAQIFGALALDPELAQGERLFVLPGTHSKWVRLHAGTIVGFATAMTGELHARLLGSSLAGDAPVADERDEADGFVAGMASGQRGVPLVKALFGARSGQLVDGQSQDWARGFLSGCLIGSEVAGLLADAPVRELIVIGDGQLIRRYRQAIESCGGEARLLSGEDCVFKGLEVARGITG